jgi:hypothetical protein
VAAAAPPAPAANARTQCLNNLRQIGVALHHYRDTCGAPPDDIRDAKGRPLLSWRVQLLPFLEEESFYGLFHLDEPWDSPHNRALVERIPRVYSCPAAPWYDGRTPYLAVRPRAGAGGEQAAPLFPIGPGDPPGRIVVVEVDEEHAVPWTKPADWDYDPQDPTRGLGRHHRAGFFHDAGGFAVLADGTVRFVPANADVGALRELLPGGGGQAPPAVPWYEALGRWPLGAVLVAWLVVTLAAAAGVPLAWRRLRRGDPLAPGEALWLVAGAGALMHLLLATVAYRHDPLDPSSSAPAMFWFLPAYVEALTALLLVPLVRPVRPWRVFLVAAVVLLALAAVDAGWPHQHRTPEESFVTALSPVLLGALAAAAAGLTVAGGGVPGGPAGRRRHWAGVAVCLLPLAWFLACRALGLVDFREPFVRYLD